MLDGSLNIRLVHIPFATEPAMCCCAVPAIFLTESGCEVSFLRRDENVMAGNDGWQEQDENPSRVKVGVEGSSID